MHAVSAAGTLEELSTYDMLMSLVVSSPPPIQEKLEINYILTNRLSVSMRNFEMITVACL